MEPIPPTTQSLISLTSSVSVYGESAIRWVERLKELADKPEGMTEDVRLRVISKVASIILADLEKVAAAHNKACEAEGWSSRMEVKG